MNLREEGLLKQLVKELQEVKAKRHKILIRVERNPLIKLVRSIKRAIKLGKTFRKRKEKLRKKANRKAKTR